MNTRPTRRSVLEALENVFTGELSMLLKALGLNSVSHSRKNYIEAFLHAVEPNTIGGRLLANIDATKLEELSYLELRLLNECLGLEAAGPNVKASGLKHKILAETAPINPRTKRLKKDEENEDEDR